jgi:hypothetical protein
MNIPYLHYQLALMRAQEVRAKAETASRVPQPPPTRHRVALRRRRALRRCSQAIKSGV